MNFFIAQDLENVLEAWRLVYYAYERDELIDANPFEVHTVSQAIGQETLVVTGCLGPLAVSTISGYGDSPAGLPLDSVYRVELDSLRREGRRLIEVGLFADRREHMNRSAEGLFELMRFPFHFGKHIGADDIVVGVHPRHAPFYMRFFAFEQIGPLRAYPTVKDNAVVLLRLNYAAASELASPPKGLAYFNENTISGALFQKRFAFDKAIVADSPIAAFLAERVRTPNAA